MKMLLSMILATGFSTMMIAQPKISFVDKTLFANLGGDAHNQGLALADFDQDGREDIYVTAVAGGPNKLYKNHGNLIFEDVAALAGVAYSGSSRVSAWGDIDNDGDPDLYVGNRDEPDILYINQGNGTFTNETIQAGIDNPFNTTSVIMADVNKDGWLDIYVSNIQNPNALYINDGSGHFTDEANVRGVNDLAVGMGAVFFDYDLDGDVDIYQCHDAQVPYILYENNGLGYFQNVSSMAHVDYAGFGMGVDAGDFNGDGNLDLYITNLYANVLFQNMGDGTFQNVSAQYHVGDEGMGWGNVFADFDNDRFQDIYVSNDTYFSPYDNALFRNTGSDFEVVSADDPCSSPYGGYATVASDLDDDGLLDILVANSGSPGVQLFQNTSPGQNHFVAFHLEGVQSNRDAIGARIDLYSPAGIQHDQVISNSGFASNNGRWIHFGLGQQTTIDKVIIHWPSGFEEEIQNININQKYFIREGEGVVSAVHHQLSSPHRCTLSAHAGQLLLAVPSLTGKSDLTLYDMMGRSAFHQSVVLNDALAVSLPPLAPGIYQVVLNSGAGSCISPLFLGSR